MARVKKINCDGNLVMIFPDNSVMVFNHPQIEAFYLYPSRDEYGFAANEPYRAEFKVTAWETMTFNGGYGKYKRIKEKKRRRGLKQGVT